MGSRVTEVLEDLNRGAPGAGDELFRLVYGELKRLAASQMRDAPRPHTLQPTALVNEAYLRLMEGAEPGWNGRAHFFGSAARAMRLILVDFARRKSARKRGGGRRPLTFDERLQPDHDTTELVISVHDALGRLEALDPQLSRIVELRFFGGLGFVEAAAVMGVSERTAQRAWEHARAWLHEEIAP